ARVEAVAPHPKRDKLKLVTLSAGGAALSVVCGAPNVPAPGGLGLLAPLGARLPGGVTLEAREIAGVASQGMLVSELELGLGPDGSGIVVLPEGMATP